jgi:protein-disulfide isomerase
MAKLRDPVTPHDHVVGGDDPPVTVVEYGDYECPVCAAAQPILGQLLGQYDDRMRLIFRHFPLVEVHPLAEPAAQSAEFAGTHGLFWPMHQAIFANQRQLSVSLLATLAARLRLSPIALRDALAAETFADKIRKDFIGGVRSGVNGTPTFFVNGVRHDSPSGVATLGSAIGQAILEAAT